MSKYRVELRPSRFKLILLLTLFAVIILSIVTWQPSTFKFQLFVQIALVVFVTILASKTINNSYKEKLPIIVFSQSGEWLEIHGVNQVSWKLTTESKVTSVVLFVNIVSSLNSKDSRWRLVFIDQVNKKDFSRLCRSITFQQQNVNQLN